MFDLFDAEGVGPVDSEAAVIARVLAADAADRECGELGPPGAGSVEQLLREQAAVGEQLTRLAQARSLRAVAALTEELRAEDTARAGAIGARMGEFVADQVAAVLGVSRRTAEVRIEDALGLAHRLPKTLAALEAGLVSLPVAHVLVRETENTDHDVAAEVEARVLDRLGRGVIEALGRLSAEEILFAGQLHPEVVARVAIRGTAGVVRTLARRALTALDAEAVREQRERARAGRDVAIWPGRVGMVWVGAELPEAQAGVVYDRIDRSARDLARCPAESRTLGQLRADVFTELLLGAGGAGDPVCSSVPVHLDITIDRTGMVTADRLGAVTAESLTDFLALAASTGGRVKVTEVVEPVCPGMHEDPGPYRPGLRLADAVIARDVTCRFPGCTVPASGCDLDHTIPHPHGPTCICNLGCLCRHHHRLKTHGGWTLTHHGDGHFTWRDPTGHTYDVWPDRALRE